MAEKLQAYEAQYPIEKVYIAHDRAYYSPGDTIWCQAYWLGGRTHLKFDAEPILFVEWYSPGGREVHKMSVKIKDGGASFEIPTALTDSSGIYQVRAYTQYQRNFDEAFRFQKSIFVTNEIPEDSDAPQASDYTVQFFPEGGDAIEGMRNKVAFKAMDDQGEAIEVEGILRYKNGETIQTIKTVHEGIGVFFWIPESGDNYEFVCTYQGREKKFALPKALSKGYIMTANNRGDEYFEMSITASPGMSLNGLEILGHLRGQVFLSKMIDQDQSYKLRIPRNQVPSGLVHMTLFDAQKRPLAERLLFNRNPEQDISVKVNTDKTDYGFKEEVELSIQTSDQTANQNAKLSVSVYNTDLVSPQKSGSNIQNYLWLQSDLKGYLPNIHQYFSENTTKTRVLLDYVLLTHGWSRFKWQEILDREAPPIEFLPLEKFEIAGRVTKPKSDNAVKANIFLSILYDEEFSSIDFTTEDDGFFYFKGFDFKDTTDVMIQANVYKEKKKGKQGKDVSKRSGNKNVDIEIIDLNEVAYTPRIPRMPSFTDQSFQKYAEAVENVRTVNEAYSGLIQSDIAEVTVEASRIALRQERENSMREAYRKRGLAYSPSSKKIFMDDVANKGLGYPDYYEFVGATVPGVNIDRSDPSNKKFVLPNANIRITQGIQPAIMVIDGLVVDVAAGNTPPFFQTIDIEFIDVIRPTQAQVLFGEYAIGGAVVFTLREEAARIGDQSAAKLKGTVSLSYPGYYQAREFFLPDYSKKPKVNPKPDLRTTIYWNPQLQLDDNSKPIKFYTGEKSGIYVIQVEGITDDGRPFVHWEDIVIGN
ncbi:MAG: Plug domain-containing protein [Saprospiraceae bacterium]